MTTTYVITPADTTTNRMTATSYPSREAAEAAATKSDYVIEGDSDILWTGRTMVDVFNALTGNRLKKFENLSDGRRRIMQALPAIAVASQPTTTGDTMATKEERAAAKAAKDQEREAAKAAKTQATADAKAAKTQEREAAKAAKTQAMADAKAAKAQEREAAKAAKLAAKAANGAARKRFADDARITLLVTENPKKHGAAATRFPLYKDGMSVKEALEAGVLRADLSWDTKKNFIAVEN